MYLLGDSNSRPAAHVGPFVLYGVKNLYKEHRAVCRNREALKSDCPWYGKYKHVFVNLANWSGQHVDPRMRSRS